MELNDFNEHINHSIENLMKEMLRLSLRNPSQASFMAKTAAAQKRAATMRLENEKRGIHVPAFMIASITQQCNLRCKGCYALAQHRDNRGELDALQLDKMVQEAQELGISIVLLAGGEPFLRKDELLSIAHSHKDILFPIFTNGLLIDQDTLIRLKTIKNAVPVVSIEGFEEETDERRGIGVYSKLKGLFEDFKQHGILYGTSITVTSQNMLQVTEENFINSLIDDGCKLFFFVEYVPVEQGSASLALEEQARDSLMSRINHLRSSLPAFFIAFPGDEKSFGGCIASGRGFIHVSAQGNVEPCPFAPFSDSNLKNKTLKECIQSGFLRSIRENHELLTDGQGGCALWEKRELVQSLLQQTLR